MFRVRGPVRSPVKASVGLLGATASPPQAAAIGVRPLQNHLLPTTIRGLGPTGATRGGNHGRGESLQEG